MTHQSWGLWTRFWGFVKQNTYFFFLNFWELCISSDIQRQISHFCFFGELFSDFSPNLSIFMIFGEKSSRKAHQNGLETKKRNLALYITRYTYVVDQLEKPTR